MLIILVTGVNNTSNVSQGNNCTLNVSQGNNCNVSQGNKCNVSQCNNCQLYHNAWADQRLAPVLQIICNLVYEWL